MDYIICVKDRPHVAYIVKYRSQILHIQKLKICHRWVTYRAQISHRCIIHIGYRSVQIGHSSLKDLRQLLYESHKSITKVGRIRTKVGRIRVTTWVKDMPYMAYRCVTYESHMVHQRVTIESLSSYRHVTYGLHIGHRWVTDVLLIWVTDWLCRCTRPLVLTDMSGLAGLWGRS